MKNQRPPAYPFFHAAQSRWREVQGRWGLTWGMRRLLHALGITLFLLPISSAHQVSAVPDHAVIEFDREALQRASLQPGTAPASDSLSMAPPTSIAIHNVAHVGSPLLPGGAVAYTITTAYAHTALLTNVVVTDSIPSGTTLVPGSAKPAQSSGPDPLVWSLGSNTPDVPGNKPPEFYCKASTLLPVLQDAWIQADNPDQVKNDDEFRIRYDSDPARHRRGVLQFDLASLPAGATITAADFYLNVKQTADHTVTIQALSSGWDETQVTWNDRLTTTPWGTPGGDFAGSYGSFAPSANGYLSADVTSLVQGWFAGSIPNEGLILVPTAGADSESKYDSSIVAGMEPYIEATYQYVNPLGCPSTLRVFPTKDAWIQADNPDQVKNDDEFRIRYDSDPARHRRGVLQFDLASLPAGATITAADFYLNVKQTADHAVTIQALTSSWDETQVTWNDRLTTTPWGTPGGDFAGSYGSFAPSANGYLSTDVTSLVQGWFAGSIPNEGLILVPTAGADSESKYDSSIVAGSEPYVEIQYLSPIVTTHLPVLQDAWIQADNPDQVKNDDEFRIRYDGDPARHRRGMLQFDLASLPAGATITAADFYLNVKQTADHTVTIQALTSGWDETQVTWNDRLTTTPWGTPGGDLAGSYGSFAPSANGYLSADVTSLVQGWVAGSIPNEGIILVPTAGADSESKYDSSIVPGKEPYIRMQYQALQASPAIGNALDAMPRLITSGTGITVTMRLTATQDTSNVAPSTLVITGTNGVGASCTGPSPTPPRTVYSNTVTTYTWYCDTKAPGNIGTLTFGAEASDSGAVSWPWAQSNSVIVVPPLTFEVTLDIQLKPSIFEVRNTAWADSDQQIQPVSASAYYPILGVDLDFGDLPDSNYATLLLINGARHVTSGLFLGAMVDPEVEGQPGPGASGDGSDDDGLVRNPADAWQPGNTVRIEASVSGGPGRLAAWYDWNGDGDFEDTGEFLDHGDISGTQTLSVTIPNDGSYVVGDPLYTRFRLFDPVDFPGGNLDAGDYAGLAIGGEVEDYYWAFGPTVVSLTSFAALPENPFLVVGRMTLPGLSMLLTFGVLHLRRRLRKSG